MKIQRRFTTADKNVYDSVEWSKRSSKITNADGSVVFEMNDAEIPKQWSQLASDIMVSKYFRKAGVPEDTPGSAGVGGTGVPPVIGDEDSMSESTMSTEPGTQHIGGGEHRTLAADHSRDGCATSQSTGPERSARQVVHRLAGCWSHWGEKFGYFDSPADAEAFYDELAYMLLHQVAAPNSPQWFNTGLNWAYGISGPAQGHFVADHKTGKVTLAPDAYTHPQPHACFIQSISDDLVNEGGIMDLWVREARLFKYGSGTGTNFSTLRGENESLSGGGKSSGLMSFLKIGDRAAGAIKSGGTTRRAAKMVCLDADHPDIESFVNWKVREELKVAAMVEGAKRLNEEQKEAAKRLGLKLDYDFNGEAYATVSGQNSNNSVRLNDAFFDAVDNDDIWNLYQRTDGGISKSLPARELWDHICYAAWRCADPGLQYDSTINAWHTCPNSGRINASNPCSEYMFLDNTACNLASVNLMKFFDTENRVFDLEGFEHAIRLWTIVLEISVLMAAFPSEEIAELSWRYRTLGLGYANLGAMLMQAGIPYDSDEARALCGCISAILTGRSYTTSAEMAAEHGPFPGYDDNRDAMLRVMRNHRRAAHGATGDYEDLPIRPVSIDHALMRSGRVNVRNAESLLDRAVIAWDEAIAQGEKHGYRNAQSTVIAPTGTIGLLMDCDTTGVEPDFALTKFKKLAGGGYFKIANQSLRPALHALGYEHKQADDIMQYVMGSLSLDIPMPEDAREEGHTLREFLEAHSYTPEEVVELENTLPTVFELKMAFNAWSMPERVLRNAGVDPEKARVDANFNGLRTLGLRSDQIDELNTMVCGTQTVEGAPHLKDEHLPVFDCANMCGPRGTRIIRSEGHIRMMAAAQPFISGAISKTINLPNDASIEDIADSYRLSWELGLKANALYRDGCKLSQPLNTRSDADTLDEVEDDDAIVEALIEVSEEVGEVVEVIVKPIAVQQPRVIERIVEKIVERPLRRRLPETRESITHKFNVAGHEGYLIVGLYQDGTPGELFITMAKEGSTIGGLMDSLGTAISVALQYGVPLKSLVRKFEHQRFEPMGMTMNTDIPFAKSLVDYIFRWMGLAFLEGYRENNAPKRAAADQSALAQGTVSHSDDADGDDKLEPPDDMASAVRNFEQERKQQRTTIRETKNGGESQVARIVKSATPLTSEMQSMNVTESRLKIGVMDQHNAQMMGDAPACDECGAITVRNGTCYRCLNCGNSMGCG